MVIYWLTPRQPFLTQKLGFTSGVTLREAFEEATKILDLLVRAGNYKPENARLVSVAAKDALEQHFRDKHIFVSTKKAELAKAVKKISDMKLTGKSKKSVKHSPKKQVESIRTRGSRA